MTSHTRSLILASLLVLLTTVLTFASPLPLYASGEPGDAEVEYGANPPSLSSTVNSIQIVFAKDGTESKIWLRICSDAPNAQMRAENVGQWTTEVFHRTEKSNGCYPSSDGWYKMVYGIDTGSTSTYRIYVTANDGILSEAAFMQRASSYDCHLTGWGTGYCTPTNNSAPVGSIDEPSAGQTVQGSVTVRGWVIDSASLNGTAITEVKVKVNGTEVGTANYGEPRTDVAVAYSDGRYGSSGYRLSFDSRQFANGTANVQVSYRSVISGSWTTMDRQVVISNPVTPTPTPPTPTPIPTPNANHTDTKLRAAVENGKTTIFMQACGKGQNYRLRSLWLKNDQVLLDQSYGALDGCSPEYRVVVNADPGDTYRFTSTVMNGSISDADFAQRRRDSCRVMAAGITQCITGDQLPVSPPANPSSPPMLTPIPACAVPFFSQVDPRWKGYKLGGCTIGGVGCALTSVSMVYRYYGVDTNPQGLSDCIFKGTSCLMNWGQNPKVCSGGKITKMQSTPFSWELLHSEVSQNSRPVVLGMYKRCGNDNRICYGHYVVVIKGSGDKGENYTIHDPGGLSGANIRLSYFTSRKWTLNQLVLFDGPNPASCLTNASSLSKPAIPDIDQQSNLGSIANTLPASARDDWSKPIPGQLAAITGSAEVLRLEDETRVILELAAQSDAGITEMQISSDTAPNEIWQPFTPYVIATAGDLVTVRFKDTAGTISEPVQAFTTPEQAEPLSVEIYNLFLPLTMR